MRWYFFIGLFLFSIFIYAQRTITLKQSISEALRNNPVIQTAKFNISSYSADTITAKLRPNPTLNNQTLQLTDSKYFPVKSEWHNGINRQVWYQLTKKIQWPRQRSGKIEFAEKNVDFIKKNYADLERDLAYRVSNQWLSVWIAKQGLDLLKLASNNIDSLVQINQIRLKNQVVTTTDLIRTQLLAEQYALQIRNTNQSYRNEIQKLKLLIGTRDSVGIDLNDPIDVLFTFSKMDSLNDLAIATRSDVAAAKSNIQLSDVNIKLQKAYAVPQPELGMIYNPQNTIPYFGFYGTIELPFFSRNQGQIQKSYVLKQQSEQNLQAIQLQVQKEIKIAFQNYQTQKKNLERFNDILSKSQQVLTTVKYAYIKGGTTLIDFLDAQRSWYDTRQLYYNALFEYRKSYIDLLYATGLITQF